MAGASPFRLRESHALVTGGGTGIGAAIAAALGAAGARVSLLGRTRPPLAETARRASLSGTVAIADVAEAAAVDAAISGLVATHGPVTVLINNAGAAESAPLSRTDPALWARMIAVNLTGVFNVTRAVLAHVPEGEPGRVVNIASTAGLKGYAYVTAYSAAKHGVIGFTRALAAELAPSAITVNAVCPGFTETPLLERSVANVMQKTGADRETARARLARLNPQGRFVQPAEVAAAVLWLCSGEAAAITGQAIVVAGGEVT